MKRFHYIIMLLLCAGASALSAQTSNTKEAGQFKISPTGRALFDAAAYAPSDSDFKAGVAIPDLRLGVKANFGNWEARADVSYRFGKLYPADIYLQYHFTPNSLLKGGYFVHQYGLQSATGASHKISMEQPIAESVFGEPRLPGVMYVWHNSHNHFAGSLYAQTEEATIHSNELGRTGWGGMARYTWHPFAQTGKVLQIGATLLAQTPQYSGDTDNPLAKFKAGFPTKVSDVSLLSATVDSVKSEIKMLPEILLAYDRWALEGTFYWAHTMRKHGLDPFNATGGYVLGRALLNRGVQYGYSAEPAYISTPTSAPLWEIVAGYSWANTDCTKAGIFGGKAQEATVTLNCYINRWITWRLNYAYTVRQGNTPGIEGQHANIFQTRIQFIF